MKVCLLLFSGLPGSGKSTLIDLLLNYLEKHAFHEVHGSSSDWGIASLQAVLVRYDTLLSNESEMHLIEESKHMLNDKPSPWREYRKEILKCVDYLIATSLGRTDLVLPQLWSEFGEKCPIDGESDVKKTLLVIIDDNMYYQSMRYQYYQLARNYEIGFGQVHLRCPVDIAIERNQTRIQKVPDDIIREMANRIEPPDLENGWERHSVVVEHQDPPNNSIEKLLSLIATATEHPEKDLLTEQAAAAEESRAVCSSNLIHQADQILRQLVTMAIKSKQVNCSKEELKSYASTVNKRKSDILSGLKQRIIIPPTDIDKDASKCNTSPLFIFIKDLFDQQ